MLGIILSKITVLFVAVLSMIFARPVILEDNLPTNTLTILSLGIRAPIVYDVTENEFSQALNRGVVHYPSTALPGEYGNTYIFGHSSDNVLSQGKYKKVFARLPDIELWADIIIADFVYIVMETKIIEPDDLSVLSQDYGRKILTLQTSYPVGTAEQRFIVIAKLQE